jgi:hypothetical protein
MGVMRFQVMPPEAAADWPEASSAYVTGMDGRVFQGRAELHGNVLTCTRPTSESGKLHVAWPVPGQGRPVLTTASLPESDSPYLLTLELARGKISELRDQSFQWQFAGMSLSPQFEGLLKEAFGLFSRASACRHDAAAASQFAQQALQVACEAAQMLGRAYTQQRRLSRRQSYTHPPALLGCTLDETTCEEPLQSRFFETFTAAVVPIEWSRVEPIEGSYHWAPLDAMVECCQQRRCVIRGGPLLDLSPGGLPAWLAPWSADFLNLQSFVCDFIETAVSRYAGRIRIWEVSARGNSGGGLSLSEEQRLALTARTVEAAQRTDTEAQLFIRVDQPWGEYQAAGGHRLTPFQFVDALLRSRIGLTGVNLEIAVGYEPVGDQSRDLLAVSRLIDLWSLLGIPLHVTLALPSCSKPDPNVGGHLVPGRSPLAVDWSEAVQAEWARDYVGMLMAKPQVTGVFWAHFHERAPHRFPHAGVIAAEGREKPILGVLREMQTAGRGQLLPAAESQGMDQNGTWVED